LSPWSEWSPEAFARAKETRAPLLAALGPEPPESLRAAEGLIARRFVAVLVDPESRPDAAARVGRGHALILDCSGNRRGVLPLPAEDLPAALERLASEARAECVGRPEAAPAPWTGAVREDAPAAGPGEAEIAAAFAALAAVPAPAPEAVESLLYAASERGDAAARAAAERGLEAMLASPWRDKGRGFFRPPGESLLRANARRARLLWDAHALTGDARWRAAAEPATAFLLHRLRDAGAGAFRRDPEAVPAVFPADGNAQAVRALLRAEAFGVPGAGEAASRALAFLQTRLYDPLLGLLHSRGGSGEDVCGLLGDVSRAALAFLEAYQADGLKSHREFADGLLRFLFQELWERDGGGFLDRLPRAGDPPVLREPHLDPALNAAALEVCWRLHHLKGVANYRRWLDWGLRGAWPASEGDPAARAALARTADMAARGRLDLELVGRPGEARSAVLLSAVRRAYAPRATVSFVDPDDQDYILAHKLTAESYPRLFGCGPDLRRHADAADADGVPAAIAAARAAEGA
jgi:uncharacterized protein YyaL (SSP411 family)